jgi:hypothetical protein
MADKNFDSLAQRIGESLSKAEIYIKGLRRTNTALMVIGIGGSALTTFLTGITATQGPVVVAGIWDWQSACIAGAILSLITTVCMGLSQQLDVSGKLMTGSQCVGRLRALDLVAATRARKAEDVTQEFAEILQTYPEIVR